MSRFLCSCLRALLYLLVAFATVSIGQSAKPTTTTATKHLVPKQKLTPEQQRGLRLLKAAQAEAAGLSPAMRAAVLWQASHGYQKLDPPRMRTVLMDAYRAATSADDEHPEVKCFNMPDVCHAKLWLEDKTLSEIVGLSPADAEELLPQAEDSVRSSVTKELIGKYVRDKKFDHAEELLRGVADRDDFPYDAVSELMAALPKDREQQRVGIFNLALGNFRTFGAADISFEDLGTLVIRFWQHLPAPTVLEAIDALLGHAKDESEKASDNRVSFSAGNASVSFSPYQYRLFELLPVLQQLDSTRAESLMREQQEVAGALKKYPKGLASLYPGYRDTPLTEREQMDPNYPALSTGGSAADRVADAAFDVWERNVESKQIHAKELANKDPKQALSVAMTIPLWGPMGPGKYSPRATTLAAILPAIAAKDSDAASKGLTELRSVLGQLNSLHAGRIASQMADTYVKLGRVEEAEKIIAEGLKIADKLYESDTDGDDPNLALKAAWPSAGLWRKLIIISTKISIEYAVKIMNEIPDQEIRSFEQVGLANALLGTSNFGSFLSLDWRASQGHQGMVAF